MAQWLDQAPNGSLVTTKLYIPSPRTNVVTRQRLLERLDAGLERKLILISAANGFGKTTLLSNWVHQKTLPFAWLSLEEGDNDPARFLSYLISSLETLDAQIGIQARALMQLPQLLFERIITTLINALDEFAQQMVLVVEDYHVIETPLIHDAMIFLIDHLPSALHLVVTTRTDPPLPIARLRARDQLCELHSADLRFTPEETATFLNQVMELNLSSEDITVLETRTEGWIAGLHLAALSLQGRADIRDRIKTFSGDERYILDYLVEEVLHRQDEDIQTFLIQTSILDRLCGSLCDAVTGQHNRQAILEELERENLFISSLDNKQQWYRYHPLFADLLRHELQRAKADVVSALHVRASEWYEQNGFPAQAVTHTLAAHDFVRASHLITQIGEWIIEQGQVATLLNWLRVLPEEMIHSNSNLGMIYAEALLSAGQSQAAENRLKQIEASTSESALLGQIGIWRSIIAVLRGDLTYSIELAQQASPRIAKADLLPRRAERAAISTAFAQVAKGATSEAQQTLLEIVASHRAVGNKLGSVVSLSALAELHLLQGQLHATEATLEQAWQIAKESELLPAAALVHLGRSELYYEWNALETAEEHLRQALRLIAENKRDTWRAYVTLARVLQAQGKADEAMTIIDKAEQFDQIPNLPAPFGPSAMHCARIWLSQGNVDAAARAADSLLNKAVNPEFTFAHEPEHITLAWLFIAQGKPDQALGLLGRLAPIAESAGRIGRVIEILTFEALAHNALGQEIQAFDVLGRALALAEPEGYVRMFVDKGAAMQLLIANLRPHITESPMSVYVSKLLNAFPKISSPDASQVVNLKPENNTLQSKLLVEPLGERELQVLRLIVDGLSTREIAGKIFLTVGTVKWHLNNIYKKLQVHSRTQAVARAKEFDLLP